MGVFLFFGSLIAGFILSVYYFMNFSSMEQPAKIAGGGFVIIYAVIMIGIMNSPVINQKHNHGSASEKNCFSNQRVIAGAIEMYNMDSKEEMKTLDLDSLVKKGYLKSKPENKDGWGNVCEYYVEGDLSKEIGNSIFCKTHGNPYKTEETKKKGEDIVSLLDIFIGIGEAYASIFLG